MKRMARLFGMVFMSFCLMTVLVACGEDNPLKGSWITDIPAMEYEYEGDPAKELVLGMISGTTIKFTDDTMILEIMGETKTEKYEIQEKTDDYVIIVTKHKTDEVLFIDENHIIFPGDEVDLCMKRIE